jgi:glycine dehydrogenase subunit 1
MRYLPHTEADRRLMLDRIGVGSIDELFVDIPADKRIPGLLDLPTAKSEIEVERHLGRMAARNVAAGTVPFFVGAGAYRHHVPASVDHLIQRSEFLTSYTPYQPEIAQGTLQYLFEFQTQVANLTGMEVANASMYDGSTATAEAVLMAHRVTKRRKAVLSGGLHPQYRGVVETVSRMAGDALVMLPPDPAARRRSSMRSTTRRPASSSSRRRSTGRSSTSPRSPRRRTPSGPSLSRSSPRSWRSARSSRRGRREPTSSSARASRSATR